MYLKIVLLFTILNSPVVFALEDCHLGDRVRCAKEPCQIHQEIYCKDGITAGAEDKIVPENLMISIYSSHTDESRYYNKIGNAKLYPSTVGMPMPSLGELHGNLMHNKKLMAVLVKLDLHITDQFQLHLSGFDLPDGVELVKNANDKYEYHAGKKP